MNRRNLITLALTALLLGLVGCREKPELSIELPPTPVLTVGSTWGVVTSNYLRMRATPSRDAAVLDGLTRGTVVEIIASTERQETVGSQTSFWYRVNLDGLKGWAFGANLETFDSRSSAESLAKRME